MTINELGDKRIQLWKKKILGAVGHSNAKLLTDLLPELERVIGVQRHANNKKPTTTMRLSSVTEETFTESRFSYVFQQFVGLFSWFVAVGGVWVSSSNLLGN